MPPTDSPLDPEAAGIPPAGLPTDQAAILNDLAQACFDSAEGFREAAEEVDNRPLTQLFRELSDQRSLFADELARLAAYKGTEPNTTHRSLSATARQWWMAARAKVAVDDVLAVLQEAERAEDVIKARYEDALQRYPTDSPIHERLVQQYDQVKAGHDRVRDLRDLQKKQG